MQATLRVVLIACHCILSVVLILAQVIEVLESISARVR